MSTPYGLSDDELTKYERRRSCRGLLYQQMSYRWDYDNWTYERWYTHPGDARRWVTIDLLTMAIYTKLCKNLPYLMYLLSITMIIYETSIWLPRCIYTYRRPCRTEYNSDYYSRDQIKCRMATITMLNTIPNTTPNLLQSYITENTVPNEIPTQTRRSQAAQLRWQLTTTNRLRNQHWIKPFQSIFPTKQNEISRRRSNDLQ